MTKEKFLKEIKPISTAYSNARSFTMKNGTVLVAVNTGGLKVDELNEILMERFMDNGGIIHG